MEKNNENGSDFLWSLAGFKKEVISKYQVEGFHAKIIGSLLILVGLYATFAWTFFFQTVTENPIIPIIAGIFMGFFILSFDRALIASLASGKSNILALIFRFVLALLLGIFLSQPMILKFYQPEIKREAELLYLEKIQEQKNERIALYDSDKLALEEQEILLQNQLTKKLSELQKAEKDFKQEMDGSGGTGKRGYAAISKQKEEIYRRHIQEYEELQAEIKPIKNTLRIKLEEMNTTIATEVAEFETENALFGTLMQVEALHSLMKKDTSGALSTRYYLLSFILILIELSALIAKLLFKTNNYRRKVELISEMEGKNADTDREIALGRLEEYKNKIEVNETALIQRFFSESDKVNEEKMDELMSEWRDSKDKTFKDYWNKFLDRFMIH